MWCGPRSLTLFYLFCSLPQSGAYCGTQKSNQPNILPGATLQYGQLVGNIPPNQMFLQYDQGVSNQQAPSVTAATPTQAMQPSSAHIIGSQLFAQQQRSAPVQNITTVPPTPQSSFYSSQTPLQQTGFYQAQQTSSTVQPTAASSGPYAMQGSVSGSLQGSFQNLVQGSMLGGSLPGSLQPSMQSSIPTNITNSMHGVLQGFNTQGLGFPSMGQQPVQQSTTQPNVNLGTQSTLNKSATPFKPAAARTSNNGAMISGALLKPTSPSDSFMGPTGVPLNVGLGSNKYSSTNQMMSGIDLNATGLSHAADSFLQGGPLCGYHSYNSVSNGSASLGSSMGSSLGSSSHGNTFLSNLADVMSQPSSMAITTTTVTNQCAISHTLSSNNALHCVSAQYSALPSKSHGVPLSSYNAPPSHADMSRKVPGRNHSNVSMMSLHNTSTANDLPHPCVSMTSMMNENNSCTSQSQPPPFKQQGMPSYGPQSQVKQTQSSNIRSNFTSHQSMSVGTFGNNQSGASGTQNQPPGGVYPGQQKHPPPSHGGPPSGAAPQSAGHLLSGSKSGGMGNKNHFNQPPPQLQTNTRPNFNQKMNQQTPFMQGKESVNR